MFPRTKLADEADKVLATFPPEAGKNPITATNLPDVEVLDTVRGGTRYVPHFWAYPALDACGKFEWTSPPDPENNDPGSSQLLGGLNQAEVLAVDVLLHGKEGAADYFPPTEEESQKALELEPLSTEPVRYVPVPHVPAAQAVAQAQAAAAGASPEVRTAVAPEELPPMVEHPVIGQVALVPIPTLQQHQTLLRKLRAEASALADHTAAGIHKVVAEIEQVWSKWNHL